MVNPPKFREANTDNSPDGGNVAFSSTATNVAPGASSMTTASMRAIGDGTVSASAWNANVPSGRDTFCPSREPELPPAAGRAEVQ